MKSFLLACVTIVAIGFAASVATERYGEAPLDRTTSTAVRLD